MNISIAVTTYNGERWLSEQLRSLASQVLPPSELVICDDQSSDATLGILTKFQRGAPFPVHVHRNETRLGFADNFLQAAGMCKGDLVAFCDQDDVWHPEKLARCVAPFEDPQCQMVGHLVEEVDAGLRQLVPQHPAITASYIITPEKARHLEPYEPPILGCAMVQRREVIERLIACWPAAHATVVRESGHHLLSHDVIAMCIAKGQGSVYILAEPLVKHRNHVSNAWSRDSRGRLRQLRSAVTTGSKQYRRIASSYRVRSRLYRELVIGEDIASLLFGRLSSAYDHYADIYDSRAALRETGSLAERLRLLYRMKSAGIYRHSEAASGRRTLMKDVIATVFGQ